MDTDKRQPSIDYTKASRSNGKTDANRQRQTDEPRPANKAAALAALRKADRRFLRNEWMHRELAGIAGRQAKGLRSGVLLVMLIGWAGVGAVLLGYPKAGAAAIAFSAIVTIAIGLELSAESRSPWR